MSSEDNRIAERLRSVENGGDGAQHKVDVDGEQSIEPDSGDVGDTGGGGGDEPAGDDENGSDDVLIAERLATAAEYEKRVARLRARAREETADRLSNCFKQDVEVELELTDEGALAGVVRIPRLKSEVEKAFDDETDVQVSPIEVTVGSAPDESETLRKR